jgi:hypothetical protein
MSTEAVFDLLDYIYDMIKWFSMLIPRKWDYLAPTILLATFAIHIPLAQATTQFYFDMPDNFEVTAGTTFEAAYFDDDGEGTYFIWNYTGLQGMPYKFSVHADLTPDEQKFNKTQSVTPQPELMHDKYNYKFAISDNITIGENMELCVQVSNFHLCEWPQPVDNFRRVLVDFS